MLNMNDDFLMTHLKVDDLMMTIRCGPGIGPDNNGGLI
jgi:hypothetical protein